MDSSSEKSFLLSVADLLGARQVDSDAICRVLELVCKRFAFEAGIIYQIDQYNIFAIQEYYNETDKNLCDTFAMDDIDPAYRIVLSESQISYIDETSAESVYELEFIRRFACSNMVCASVIDDNRRINGFVILADTRQEGGISEQGTNELALCLNLLSRCLETRLYKNKVTFSRLALESILDNTGIDIYVNDFYTHDILYVNKSMAAPYGGGERFLGNKCWAILFPGQDGPCEFCPQKKLIDEEGNPTNTYSWDYQRPFDGSWFRVFSSAFRWVDGRLAHVVSSADITENKRNEALIDYMAHYDSLTSLPNRRMLVSECERRINHAGEGTKGYLLFFDIDGFKAINDTFGHDAGDEFLVKLGAFFSDIPMLKDAIYRNGGDEFVALLDGDLSEANLSALVSFIHERFKKPWTLKNGDVFCNTSVGVACYPEDGVTAEALLSKADQAMYQVKKAGGGGLCFGRELKGGSE